MNLPLTEKITVIDGPHCYSGYISITSVVASGEDEWCCDWVAELDRKYTGKMFGASELQAIFLTAKHLYFLVNEFERIKRKTT